MTRSIIGLLLTFLMASCTPEKSLPNSLALNDDFQELISIADKLEVDPITRYTALEPVISMARNAGEIDWLNAYLGEILEKHPNDPYGAYYLMAMAEGAMDTGSDALALDYFRRLLKNHPDLEIRRRSLHLIAMSQITSKTDDPREAIAIREKMQNHYADRIDLGRNLYATANEYREIGDWTAMYRTLKQFQAYPNSDIPGVPDVHARVRSDLAFHSSKKTWTMDDLDKLVGTIKYAIRTQDAKLLTQYQADSFFLMNWSQETSDSFTHIPMSLSSFLKDSVRYRRELEDFSNEHEAYLWTAGWTWKIPTWYLYFRRVDYPADPEINGQWEWAGIYFGERL